MSFTNGRPWRLRRDELCQHEWSLSPEPDADGESLCFAWATDEGIAHLLHAAPDLLAALQWYVENDETNQAIDWDNQYYLNGKQRAEAAIAKATKGAGT